MGYVLMNYFTKFCVTIWAFCSTFLLVSDWFVYVEPFGKLIVLILGLIAGLIMTSIALTKKKQADAELKTAQLKYEEERIRHYKEMKESENLNVDFDEIM